MPQRYRRLFFLSLLFLTGCVTEGAFEYSMKTWVGAPIQQYEKGAGPSDRIEQALNGNRVYVYKLKYYQACTVFWEVDKNGTIVNWRHEGIDCIAPWF